MDWLQIIVLSLVQGITEFLPISSSAHLILTPHVFGWSDQGLAFDVAVHLGTLSAVLFYFRQQLSNMFRSCLLVGSGKGVEQDTILVGKVMLATIPVAVVGSLFHDQIVTYLRSPLVIAATTIVFGLALLLANRVNPVPKDEYQIGLLVVVLIGLAQALALIPGTSRSGITMMAAVMLGMSQASAARFSFLLAIPVIIGGAVFEGIGLLQQPSPVDWLVLVTAMLLSGVSALACIYLFLQAIERIGFTPFVIYRLLLGAVLLVIFV